MALRCWWDAARVYWLVLLLPCAVLLPRLWSGCTLHAAPCITCTVQQHILVRTAFAAVSHLVANPTPLSGRV